MFKGKVISGQGVGKTLGYPTANLDTPQSAVRVSTGVYAAYATCVGRRYPAALVLRGNPWKVEVHFFQYSAGDCYGRVVAVEPVQKVSEIEEFESMEELKEKIALDVEAVRRVLKL